MLFTPSLRRLKSVSLFTRGGHSRRSKRWAAPLGAIERLEPRILLSHVDCSLKPDHPHCGGGGGDDDPPLPDPPPPADPAFVFTTRGGTNKSPAIDLNVMNADGSNQTVIWSQASGGFGSLAWPAWSPDIDTETPGYQGTVAFSSSEPDSLSRYQQLVLIDVAVIDGVPQGSNVRTVLDANVDLNVDSVVFPHWSPDLNTMTTGYQGKIAFSSGDGRINLIDVGSTNSSVVLLESEGIDFKFIEDLTWSPDGSRIAFSEHRHEGDLQSDTLNLIDVAFPHEVTTVLSVSSNTHGNINNPDWSRSPDSSQVAYIGAAGKMVFIVDVDAQNPTPIPVQASFLLANLDVRWSPNDLELAISGTGYDIRGKKLRSGIKIVNLVGNEETFITDRKSNFDWRRDPNPMPNQITPSSSTSLSSATTLQTVSDGGEEGSSLFVFDTGSRSSVEDADELSSDPVLVTLQDDGFLPVTDTEEDESPDDDLAADPPDEPIDTETFIDELFADLNDSLLGDLLTV